jgi:hypothetical protein
VFARSALSPLTDPLLAGRAEGAGRVCPADYSYPPTIFARAPEFDSETLYVAGGVYGNLAALAAIEAMAAREHVQPTIILNGDFHWFDADPDWFAAVENSVAPHHLLRGNAETEVGRGEDIGIGCGCAYPEDVDDGVVQRSNAIMTQLASVAPAASRSRLCALPMHCVAQVGSLRVGIVHGDAVSLAGWRFAANALDNVRRRGWLEGVHKVSNIDLFACTHTCLAALRDFDFPAGRMTIINNGAAGMPNFSGVTFGVITRIGTTPSVHPPLYGLERDGVHIGAIAVAYDQQAFLERFLARWPRGSPAHASYFQRIVDGPDYSLAQAAS